MEVESGPSAFSPPHKTLGTRAFENLAVPAVCFASSEFNCFTEAEGGIGRAFLSQMLQVLSEGKYPVRGLLLRMPNEPPLTMKCRDEPRAEALAPFVGEISTNTPWLRGLATTYPSVRLLEWLRQHPRACRVLHVPDWNGIGAHTALAKRAGLPEFADLHVNVQIHGPEFQLRVEGRIDGKSSDDLGRDALERILLQFADTAVFLNAESLESLAAIAAITPNRAIIPNVVHPVPARLAGLVPRPPPGGSLALVRPRHIIFYGKLSRRKRFALFMNALARVASRRPSLFTRNNITISVVGPFRLDRAETDVMVNNFFKSTGVGVAMHTDFDQEKVLEFFLRHAADGLVVLPSYYEVQSFALFDVLQAGIPFIASDIFAHCAQVPAARRPALLFAGEENELADKLISVVERGLPWAPLFDAVPYNAAQLWSLFHDAVFQRRASTAFGLALPGPAPPVRPEALPLATVVVTVCERTRYLHLSLQSIAAQDFPASRLRVLLAAACPISVRCEDFMRTERIAAAASALVSVTCIDSPEPRTSLGRIRNIAAERATTDLVLFLDDDDELPSNTVRDYVRASMLNPDRHVFTSFADIFYEDGAVPISNRTLPHSLGARWATLGSSIETALFMNTVGSACMLVRRSSWFWKASRGFSDVKGVGCEDWEVLTKASLVDAVQLVPVRGLWYRKVSTAGQREGMMAEINSPEGYVACRDRNLLGAVKFAAAVCDKVKFMRLLSALQFGRVKFDTAGESKH